MLKLFIKLHTVLSILFVSTTLTVGFKEAESESIYSNTWIIQVKEGQKAAKQLSDDLFLQYHGPVGSLKDMHIVQHKTVARRRNVTSKFHHQVISTHPRVLFAEQQTILSRKKRQSDPLYNKQWYLNNSGQTNGICQEINDINVLSAWSKGVTGKGVVVSVLDDGLEYTHPDLKESYHGESSYNFNSEPHNTNPSPRYTYNNINRHGTRCAGEIAATKGNGVCGRGVAYHSKVGGIRMLDGDVTDAIEAGSLSHKRNLIDIYSISWGPDDDGYTVDGPGPLAKKALSEGVAYGRHGLGSIFVWATGNGGGVYDYCSCDGYINSPYTIAIGAIDNCGRKPWYSELCPGTFAVTYSSGGDRDLQIVTTDLRHDCTTKHSGTSAAAPIAAGIFALVLQVNPKLTWRDLQHLIARSSKKISPKDSDWIINGAGHPVNIKFGFGALDVGALIDLANKSDWRTVNKRKEYISPRKTVDLKSIDEDQYSVTSKIFFSKQMSQYLDRLEHVHAIVTLKLCYSYSRFKGRRGHHSIKLISPSGTTSELLRERPRDTNYINGFTDWEFLTVFHWNESPYGKWTLIVTDHSKSIWKNKCELSWKLKLSGTSN